MKVLVINVRGLPVGLLGPYGNDWIETPAFDRLATEGVVFDTHLADGPSAEGAGVSWRTGRYHLPHPENNNSSPQDPHDLLTLFHQHGIRTSLVRDGSRPASLAFAEGWQRQVTTEPGSEGTAMEYALDAWQAALEDLGTVENWFLWLELATTLPPWHVPEGYVARYMIQMESLEGEDEEEEEAPDPLEPLLDPVTGPVNREDDLQILRLRCSAAGAVTYLDAGLGLLLEELQKRGLLDDVVLVVTSDHGMPLGEHAMVGLWRPWMHEELIHTPLLIRWPAQLTAGRRVCGVTQALDLMPTFLDLFRVPIPCVHGQSLLPLARGECESIRSYGCAGLRQETAVELVLRSPEWAYVHPVAAWEGEELRRPQLYIKPEDIWEVNDVTQHHLELVEQLTDMLRQAVEATRAPGPLQMPELGERNGSAPNENHE